jgi:hypothetical protein
MLTTKGALKSVWVPGKLRAKRTGSLGLLGRLCSWHPRGAHDLTASMRRRTTICAILAVALLAAIPASAAPDGDFSAGCYEGGTASSIALPWSPSMLWLTPMAAEPSAPLWVTDQDPPNHTFNLDTPCGAYPVPNVITGLGVDGVNIGESGSVPGRQYCWDAWRAGARLITGSYTGSGGQLHTINGLPFRPDLVIVEDRGEPGEWNIGYVAPFIRTSAMERSAWLSMPWNAPDCIPTLTADGFTTDGLDTKDHVYVYVAAQAASDFLKVGTYTGDGEARQRVSLSSCTPKFLWVNGNVTNDRLPSGQGQALMCFPSADPNGILSLDANGFTVGTSRNEAGGAYQYWAMCAGTQQARR